MYARLALLIIRIAVVVAVIDGSVGGCQRDAESGRCDLCHKYFYNGVGLEILNRSAALLALDATINESKRCTAVLLFDIRTDFPDLCRKPSKHDNLFAAIYQVINCLLEEFLLRAADLDELACVWIVLVALDILSQITSAKL